MAQSAHQPGKMEMAHKWFKWFRHRAEAKGIFSRTFSRTFFSQIEKPCIKWEVLQGLHGHKYGQLSVFLIDFLA